MSRFIERHPIWALIIMIVVVIIAWAVFAVWPAGLEAVIGKKKVFLSALLNGITLGSLYFLVASGFTLIFGLMRNVNLAQGSLYVLGGYIGYEAPVWTGWWILGFVFAFVDLIVIGDFAEVHSVGQQRV